MQIRRPLAALLTALALFGGGATLTACSDADPTTPNEGTTDDDGGDTGDDIERDDLPNNTDPEQDDQDDDQTDPD